MPKKTHSTLQAIVYRSACEASTRSEVVRLTQGLLPGARNACTSRERQGAGHAAITRHASDSRRRFRLAARGGARKRNEGGVARRGAARCVALSHRSTRHSTPSPAPPQPTPRPESLTTRLAQHTHTLDVVRLRLLCERLCGTVLTCDRLRPASTFSMPR